MNISHKKPDLVSNKTFRKINKIFQEPVVNEPTWEDNLMLFYTDYIKPNLFPLIVLIILIIFLSIKYLLKENKEKRKKKHKTNNEKTTNESKKDYTLSFGDTYESIIDEISNSSDNISNNDVYYNNRQPYDDNNNDDDNESFYSISKDYNQLLKDNNGQYSDQMLKDTLNEKSTKMSFDELARMVSSY